MLCPRLAVSSNGMDIGFPRGKSDSTCTGFLATAETLNQLKRDSAHDRDREALFNERRLCVSPKTTDRDRHRKSQKSFGGLLQHLSQSSIGLLTRPIQYLNLITLAAARRCCRHHAKSFKHGVSHLLHKAVGQGSRTSAQTPADMHACTLIRSGMTFSNSAQQSTTEFTIIARENL